MHSNDKGGDVCPHCGKSLGEQHDERESAEWVVVYESASLIDAELCKGNLDGAEIPVNAVSSIDHTFVIGDTPTAKVKLFVPKEFQAEALEIIEAVGKGSTEELE